MALVLLAGGALAAHHVWQLRHHPTSLEVIVAAAFGWLCFTALGPYLHRDVPLPAPGSRSRRALDRLRVLVTIPVHNEDPAMLAALLDSLAVQTRRPDQVHLIENGSPDQKAQDIFLGWAATLPAGMQATYSHRVEAGKREAQAVAWRDWTDRLVELGVDPDAEDADVIVTVDSDVILDPHAIERGLAPFLDRRVTTVGGLLIGANPLRNMLTRLIELGFVCSFLNGRASWSLLGSVGVHCGGLAFHRGWVLRKYLDHYLTHTVGGRRMPYGDDAMATRYGLLEGRSLLQMSAFGYTLHPVNLRHLTRQRIRWWRSWWWGNVWLLRAFPATRAIWWLTVANFVRWVWYGAAVTAALVVGPARTGITPWMFLAWLAGVSYVANARYLSVRRPDQPWLVQFGTYLLSPASSVLNLYLCSVLQWVGLFTHRHTGWSTRARVEVGLADARPHEPLSTTKTDLVQLER